MKKTKFLYLLILLIGVSCVKDIDLDQIDDIEIFTDHNVTLVHFDLGVLNFLDEFNNELLVFSDTTRLPIFIGSFTKDYLIQADFNYILNNSFDRNILFQFELLDSIDNSLLKFDPVFVPSGTTDLSITQSIFEDELPTVFETEKIVVTFAMTSGGIPLNPFQNNKINLKSALILHYKLTVDNE